MNKPEIYKEENIVVLKNIRAVHKLVVHVIKCLSLFVIFKEKLFTGGNISHFV